MWIKYYCIKEVLGIRIKTSKPLHLLLALLLILNGCAQKASVPEGFVYLDQIIPTVKYDIRYYSENNFVGSKIDGYEAVTAILTAETAEALKNVSKELEFKGYYLKIFDGYRPQKAVNHFIRWGEDLNDTQMKPWYYPNIEKKDLFKLGYIAKKSSHTRGSTVDLTLVYKETGEEIDMGSSYDFLDSVSAHGTPLITAEQADNRELLRKSMEEHGFKAYYREWWHYTLVNEPYPDTYFDFDVR